MIRRVLCKLGWHESLLLEFVPENGVLNAIPGLIKSNEPNN